MSSNAKITIHPACCVLPALPAKAFEDLCASIKAIGLQQPILVDADGAVLDGKNRLWACEKVGVAPRFQKAEVVGGTVRWVLDLNKPRFRTPSQRALAGAKMATAEHGGDRGNQHTGGKSPNGELTREEAAKELAISPRAIDRAKLILAHGVDELIEYLERGEITLGCAEWAAKANPEEQTLACAVDAKAVKALATQMREGEQTSVAALSSVEVLHETSRLIRRWPKTEPLDLLMQHLSRVVSAEEQRRSA